jgi:hypothetical protein
MTLVNAAGRSGVRDQYLATSRNGETRRSYEN